MLKKYTLAVEWLTEAKRLASDDETIDVATVNAELVVTMTEVNHQTLGLHCTSNAALELMTIFTEIPARQITGEPKIQRSVLLPHEH